MAAPYIRRFPGGFVDKPLTTTPIEAAFLNAVEDALISLLGDTPVADEVGVWVGGAGGGLVYQKIKNAQIDAAAGIDKSKLAALNIEDADIAAAANIAASKLAGNIPFSKLAGYPTDATKFARGDGAWASPGTWTPRYARYYLNPNLSLPNASWTAVTWGGTDATYGFFESHDMQNPASNPSRITPGEAGIYRVTATGHFNSHATGYRALRLTFQDGTSLGESYSTITSAATYHSVVLTTLVRIPLVTDWFQLEAYQSSGGALDLMGGGANWQLTNLGIEKVGTL